MSNPSWCAGALLASALAGCASIRRESPPADPVEPALERIDGAGESVEDAAPPPVAASGNPVPAAADSPPSELSSLVREHYEYLAARNWAGLAAHFWPGAAIVRVRANQGSEPTGVLAQTVEQFLADAALLPPADDPLLVELVGHDVAVADAMAHVLARYRARSRGEDDVHVWEGVDAFTFVRRDGCWRIAALFVGSDFASD